MFLSVWILIGHGPSTFSKRTSATNLDSWSMVLKRSSEDSNARPRETNRYPCIEIDFEQLLHTWNFHYLPTFSTSHISNKQTYWYRGQLKLCMRIYDYGCPYINHVICVRTFWMNSQSCIQSIHKKFQGIQISICFSELGIWCKAS